MAACGRCGQENPASARFCPSCGAAVSSRPTTSTERKTVTILFCDVTGSTRLGELMDPEAVGGLMHRYFSAAEAAILRHGGTVEKFIGDAVMAVFGVPVVHEDDALRAVRAAVDIREELVRLNEELQRVAGVRIQVRTGLSTGEVLASDPIGAGTFVTGDAVNEAARLEQRAQPDEILLSLATYRLVRDAVSVETLDPLTVRGKLEPVRAFRVIGIRPGSSGHMRHLDAPLVGRETERQLLTAAFERALREGNCHLVTVLGPAGIGKTRLVAEAVGSFRERAAVLSARCLAYGEDLAFRPLRDLVEQAASLGRAYSARLASDKIAERVGGEELSDLVAQRVTEVIGLSNATAPIDELFWGVRKLLEAVGRSEPLVVLVDDAHWAEPSFLDLLENIADWWQGSPLLLVCVARPELLDERLGWGGGRMNATSLLLEPLDRSESEQLLANLLDGATMDEEAAACIGEAADGNPLFVEEYLSMLIDDELLREREGRWEPSADLSHLPVPPSIETLLVARLERLPEAERALLERASVVGREFWPEAVVQLTPEAERDLIQPLLVRLVNRQLLRFERSSLVDRDGFAFRHALLRDAAYRRVSKRRRSDLHERFASFLEIVAADSAGKYDEVIGHHLEQAHGCRADLGPVDDHGRRLASQGASRLAAAGCRALARSDFRSATGLLGRARGLGFEDDRELVEALGPLGESLARVGDLTGAEACLDEAVARAVALGDAGHEWHARLELAGLRLWTDPDTGIDEVGRAGAAALDVFERLGDELGRAKAGWMLAQEQHFRCQGGSSVRLLRAAAGHAEAGGDVALLVRILASLVSQAPFGPMPVSEGLALCDSVTAQASRSRTLESAVLDGRALFEAMRGRLPQARALLEQERAVLADIGDDLGLASEPLSAGGVELLAGQWARAEDHLRSACQRLGAIGERQLLSSAAAFLAQALVAQGREEEADGFSRLSEDSAAANDILAQVGWRRARARVLAHLGAVADAEVLAREALDLAESTDFLNTQGDTLMDLAAVLRLTGRRAEAEAAVGRARALYDAKENVASAVQTDEALARLQALS